MTIDYAVVLQFSVADRAKNAAKPSCPCASRDIDAIIEAAFVNHGGRWAQGLIDSLGRKNFADRKRMEEIEKNRKMDEMAAEIAQLRSSSQNLQNPPSVQQYVPPTSQQYVPLLGQQYSFPPQVYNDPPPHRPSPQSKRKMKQESADDSDAEPSVSMSALKKFFKKQY